MNTEMERPHFPMRADHDRHTGRADDGKKISGARKEGEEKVATKSVVADYNAAE